jgi:hypothetical protein
MPAGAAAKAFPDNDFGPRGNQNVQQGSCRRRSIIVILWSILYMWIGAAAGSRRGRGAGRRMTRGRPNPPLLTQGRVRQRTTS